MIKLLTLGIDIGGTTTDLACFENGKLIHVLSVRADDPVTSASGALGKFISESGKSLAEIQQIAVTGVGATSVGIDLFGIPLRQIDEFSAIGMGGLFLSGLKEAVVVSLGTGTAVVKAKGRSAQHLGGSGVGGGTLIGLSKYMLQVSDFELLSEMAEKGDLSKVDLSIRDIAGDRLGNLPANATASNFGKHSDKAGPEDMAFGIINLVCQTVGMLAVFASRTHNTQKVVLTGKMTRLAQLPEIFRRLEAMFGIRFIIPKKAEYSTAVGAACALVFDT